MCRPSSKLLSEEISKKSIELVKKVGSRHLFTSEAIVLGGGPEEKDVSSLNRFEILSLLGVYVT